MQHLLACEFAVLFRAISIVLAEPQHAGSAAVSASGYAAAAPFGGVEIAHSRQRFLAFQRRLARHQPLLAANDQGLHAF
jgi:hypothetical protein